MGKRERPLYFHGDQWFNKKWRGAHGRPCRGATANFVPRTGRTATKRFCAMCGARRYGWGLRPTPLRSSAEHTSPPASAAGLRWSRRRGSDRLVGRRSLQNAKSTKRNSSARRSCSSRSVRWHGNSGAMRTGPHPTPLPKLRKHFTGDCWRSGRFWLWKKYGRLMATMTKKRFSVPENPTSPPCRN